MLFNADIRQNLTSEEVNLNLKTKIGKRNFHQKVKNMKPKFTLSWSAFEQLGPEGDTFTNKKIWFINGDDNVNWPPYRDWKAFQSLYNWAQKGIPSQTKKFGLSTELIM